MLHFHHYTRKFTLALVSVFCLPYLIKNKLPPEVCLVLCWPREYRVSGTTDVEKSIHFKNRRVLRRRG